MGLLAELDALRSSLACVDPDDVPAAECATVVERLAATEKACAVARARFAARAASGGAHRDRGHRDAADWLAQVAGTSVKAADRELEVGTRLEELGAAKAAAVAGELSLEQVAEIALTEHSVPGSEAEMVTLAREANLTRLKERGRDLRLDAMDIEVLAARQRAARHVRQWRDELGMVRGAFALEPAAGVAFVARLEAETKRIRRAAKKALGPGGAPERFDAYAADALIKLTEGGTERRAVRADVVVVKNLDTGRSHVVGAGPVPDAVVTDLVAGGAFVKAVLHDGVDITTVAHYGKSMPVHLRTALELGKPPKFEGVRCVRCGRRFHLEWDHIDPRANGGPWSFTNNQGLCWECHVKKTEEDRRAGLLGELDALLAERTGGRKRAPP